MTIGVLRGLYPKLFEPGIESQGVLQPHFVFKINPSAIGAGNQGLEDLGELISIERIVAAFAYGSARGIPEPDGWDGQEGLAAFKKSLVKIYNNFGLAFGTFQATEMIRDIERQAQKLASTKSP